MGCFTLPWQRKEEMGRKQWCRNALAVFVCAEGAGGKSCHNSPSLCLWLGRARGKIKGAHMARNWPSTDDHLRVPFCITFRTVAQIMAVGGWVPWWSDPRPTVH